MGLKDEAKVPTEEEIPPPMALERAGNSSTIYMYIMMKYKALLDLKTATITSSKTASGQNSHPAGLLMKSSMLAQRPAIENSIMPAFCLGTLSTTM